MGLSKIMGYKPVAEFGVEIEYKSQITCSEGRQWNYAFAAHSDLDVGSEHPATLLPSLPCSLVVSSVVANKR